jgi:hypothetical protein
MEMKKELPTSFDAGELLFEFSVSIKNYSE